MISQSKATITPLVNLTLREQQIFNSRQALERKRISTILNSDEAKSVDSHYSMALALRSNLSVNESLQFLTELHADLTN
jgi:hypothetical protein